jgi:CHAT domain-containing protein
MPETPDAAPLPATVRERQMLVGRFPYPLVLTGAQATAARVLAELPHHPVAHFACHAAHDPSDPSAGRLLLHDHREHPLTVRDIARLHLDAELAFLSACDTSRAGPRLPDEAIHLTSSFQIAGFAQVIGTLWPVDDEAAADIAADVYAHLTPGPGSEPDTARTALALHAAVRRVRQRHPRTPTRWAAHLHPGA